MERNSPEYIGWLLATNDRAVERAILVLYSRQTEDEQMSKNTRHRNGRGFNSSEARKGSYMAKWVESGKHLSGQWLIDARTIAINHIGQLVEEATLKMEREQAQKQAEADLLNRISREAAEEQAILAEELEFFQE